MPSAFSLRCFNGLAVSMPAAFLIVSVFHVSRFNFVEGFAVLAALFQWLRRFNAFGV